MIFVSIPSIIISVALESSLASLWVAITFFVINLVFVIFYFSVIPIFWKGKTLFKWIFRFRLYSYNKVTKWYIYFLREFYFTLPYLVITSLNIFLLNYYQEDMLSAINGDDVFLLTKILIQSIITFISLWTFVIYTSLFISKKNQYIFDKKLKVFNVYIKPVEHQQTINNNDIINKDYHHIHLGDNQPGNIDEREIDKIKEK
ncbi:RDD family protein [Spiroplasma endosymbiont of Anurida maritima]|uniref:hypothetical protein n=1 Tax=Spiroplasma endosymbiont of Anurida maritima TaxID=2967972 RepID=UPI0036D299F3